MFSLNSDFQWRVTAAHLRQAECGDCRREAEGALATLIRQEAEELCPGVALAAAEAIRIDELLTSARRGDSLRTRVRKALTDAEATARRPRQAPVSVGGEPVLPRCDRCCRRYDEFFSTTGRVGHARKVARSLVEASGIQADEYEIVNDLAIKFRVRLPTSEQLANNSYLRVAVRSLVLEMVRRRNREQERRELLIARAEAASAPPDPGVAALALANVPLAGLSKEAAATLTVLLHGFDSAADVAWVLQLPKVNTAQRRIARLVESLRLNAHPDNARMVNLIKATLDELPTRQLSKLRRDRLLLYLRNVANPDARNIITRFGVENILQLLGEVTEKHRAWWLLWSERMWREDLLPEAVRRVSARLTASALRDILSRSQMLLPMFSDDTPAQIIELVGNGVPLGVVSRRVGLSLQHICEVAQHSLLFLRWVTSDTQSPAVLSEMRNETTSEYYG